MLDVFPRSQFRLVGLSATPGSGIKEIQNVVTTLRISQIEVRTEDDPVVKQYIHNREEENIIVKQPDAIKILDSKFSELVVPILERLREEKVSPQLQYNSANLKPFTVLTAWKEYKEKTGDHRLDGHFDTLRGLTNIRQLLKEHGVVVAKTKLSELMQNAKFDLLRKLMQKPIFQSLLQDLSRAANSNYDAVGSQSSPEDLTFNNPKYSKLVEVLVEHFERKQAIGESTRAIVFSQWRESVTGIVAMLSSQNPSLLKPTPFIGQSNKSGSKGKRGGGMNQSQQQKVLDQFSKGNYNVLVCTCVGEEGLDIGEVDLIVNFDVVKSSIRSIQRSGRTGRARVGRVINLMSEGQEVRSFNESKENAKKIARSLKDPKVFKFCPNDPMFPDEPELFRQKMTVKAFHMSQVGGHTPKIRKRSVRVKRVQNCAEEIDDSWKLTLEQEIERRKHFGYLPRINSCLAFEKNSGFFPASLRRSYLKSRRQSTTASGRAITCITLRGIEKRFSTKSRTHMLKTTTTNENETVFNRTPSEIESWIRGNSSRSEDLVIHDESKANDDALDVCSNGSSVSRVQGIQYDSENTGFREIILNDEEDSPNIALDDIFGPILEDDSQGVEQIAYVFDSFNRRHCSVIAPPRNGVDFAVGNDSLSSAVSIGTDEDEVSMASRSSKQSQLSVNTMNDDLLCAFFEKNDSTDVHAGCSGLSSDDVQFLTPKPDSLNFHSDDPDEYSTGGDVHLAEEHANAAVSDNGTEENFTARPQAEIATSVDSCATNSILAHSMTHLENVDDIEKRRETKNSVDAPEIRITFSGAAANQITEATISMAEFTSKHNATNDQNEFIRCASRGVVDSSSGAPSEPVQIHSNVVYSQDDAEIVAFQLPTPPESSDDDGDDASSGDHTDQYNVDKPTSKLQKEVVKEKNKYPENKKSGDCITPEVYAGYLEKRTNTFPMTEAINDIPNSQESTEQMAPLQLPTQFSSSEDDDECEEDDDQSIGEVDKTKIDTVTYEDTIARAESTNEEVKVCCRSADLSCQANLSAVLEESSELPMQRNGDQHSKQHDCLGDPLENTPEKKHVHFQNLSSQFMASHGLTDTPIRVDFGNPSDECLTDTPELIQGGRKRPRLGPHELTDAPVEKSPVKGDLKPRMFAKHRKRLKPVVDSPNTPKTTSSMAGDVLTDTPVKGRLCRKGYDHSDECLTDTPEINRGCQNSPPFAPDDLTNTPIENAPAVGVRTLRAVSRQSKRLRRVMNTEKEKQESPNKNPVSKKDRLKKTIEEKYKCRFLDTEAIYDDSDDDSKEEDEVRKIESEELSQDSFINDGSQLGYTQDDLDRINADSEIVYSCDDGNEIHRQVDHQHNIDNQFRTPVFNRRMRRPELYQSQVEPSSQRGLGNMHFIRSVLEHHRQGGDADDVEEEYKRLVGHESPSADSRSTVQNSPFAQHNRMSVGYRPTRNEASPFTSHTIYSPPIGAQMNTTADPGRQTHGTQGGNSAESSVEQGSRIVPTNNMGISLDQTPGAIEKKPPGLTSEQRAMIEAKRLEALRRRQQRMQQQMQHQQQNQQQQQQQKQTPPIRINPYVK